MALDSVAANERPQFVWKARWTASLVVALLLAFTAGISVVGVVHQAVWMMTGKERLTSGGTFDAHGRPLHSAMTMILPFVEQQALFETIDLQQPWNGDSNRDVFKTVVPIYQFPPGVPNPELSADPGKVPGFALSNYAGNIRVLRLGQSMRITDIRDGTSNTILFGEVHENLRPWGDPLNVRDPAIGINQGPKSFGSPFSAGRGCNMLLADGSVRFVSESTALDVLKALSTPASGEPLPEF